MASLLPRHGPFEWKDYILTSTCKRSHRCTVRWTPRAKTSKTTSFHEWAPKSLNSTSLLYPPPTRRVFMHASSPTTASAAMTHSSLTLTHNSRISTTQNSPSPSFLHSLVMSASSNFSKWVPSSGSKPHILPFTWPLFPRISRQF